MKETIIKCDICGNETKRNNPIIIKWFNERVHYNIDVCLKCKKEIDVLTSKDINKPLEEMNPKESLIGIFKSIFKINIK